MDLRLRLIAIVPESTNQGNPSEGNIDPFPPFGNIGAPYIATLSLPGFTIGFPVWFFSTTMVLNIQTTPQPNSPPPEQYQPQVYPKVGPLPSSHVISSSLSSTLHGQSLDSSN